MIVENWEVYGLNESIKASKYPMAVDTSKCTSEITERTIALAQCPMGTGHDQFLTGIVVQLDLTLSIKCWVEAQRYHFLDFVSSQSTMHRATKFDIDKQCNEYVSPKIMQFCKELVEQYNENPTAYNYLLVLYNLPTGFQLTARMTTNYRQLKTIYNQRKNHRIPEWREFCKWIETCLPYSEFITGGDNTDD